jgi:AcrR family transcriptional regulator
MCSPRTHDQRLGDQALPRTTKRTRSRAEGAELSLSDDENRAEILEAAARAFMTSGYGGSSIDMVADELGCTKGRIYYQYRSKAELFFDVQKEAMRMNIAAVAPFVRDSAPALDRLRNMIERSIVLIMVHLPFQRVLMQGVEMHLHASTTPPERKMMDFLIEQRDEYERMFIKVVTEGVRNKEFRQVDSRLFVKALLGSIVWVTVWYRPGSDTQLRREKLASELADYMLLGLSDQAKKMS